MLQFFIFFLIFFTVNGIDFMCNQTANKFWTQNTSLPLGLALAQNYKVSVSYTDWDRNITSLIIESHTSSEQRIKKVVRNGTTNYIIGARNFTYNESSCDAFESYEGLAPVFPLHQQLISAFNFNGFALGELVNATLAHQFSFSNLENVTKIVNAVDAVIWLGCGNLTNTSIVQVEVAFAGDRALMSYSPTVKNPYILSMEFAIFNASTNHELVSHTSIDITQLEVLPADETSQSNLPDGMFCNGLPEAEIPSILPEKFEISFDYTDIPSKSINDIDLIYNGAKRLLSMNFNAASSKGIPFIGNATLPTSLKNVLVVHDFQYGFQYLIDPHNGICSSVSAIDAKMGDVILLNATTSEIDLKTPSHILLNAAASKFYYSGKRIVDGKSLNVYFSQINSSTGGASSVIEMLYTLNDWMVDSASGPFLHSIIEYSALETNKREVKSIIRVHSFKNGSASNIPQLSTISVYPCLKFSKESYLYVTVKDGSLPEIEKLGISNVRDAIRETVAETADVSLLRVADFFFKQMQENLVVFFVIGDLANVIPANTFNRSNETSVEDAVRLLNVTLQNADIVFEVVDGSKKTQLKLSKSSLGVVPTKWGPLPTPAPSFNGYTGGSMFVLGFFMLLLGILCGIAGVYFIYKRQHLSGLPYQIFE